MTTIAMYGRLAALSLVLLGGCSGSTATNRPADTDEAAARTAAAKPAGPVRYSLAAGVVIDAALTNTITSRTARAGDAFTAQVVEDVRNAGGAVAIPAGSTVHGTIVEVSSAPNDNSTGTLTLDVSSVTVHGQSYDLNATIDALETVHKGRGIETVDAARTAGGAAAGAIIGQVITKNPKGTIIGGVLGGAAGAAVSAIMKDKDIVLPAGSHLLLTLQERLTVSSR
ncbi:MAG TPA: glycine zipper 2TM domain-containing protein [Gemmatimonadales bacterium]